jgi:ABC-2 type transport system ATP-binding protein
VNSVIEVSGLRKSYGGKLAVADVSFEVGRGEVFGLLGPNGAGKTTTVEILEGLRHRSGGEVRVLGMDPQRANRTWRDRIGIVLQTHRDHASWKVGELAGQMAMSHSRSMPVAEALEAVGLGDRVNAPIRSLSGGLRRRLDVALGIIGRPDMLFLDEPTTGLDPEVRRQFWQMIRKLSEDGTSILLTTHYLEEAEQLAHRVGVLRNGTIAEIAVPALLGSDGRGSTVSWVQHNEVKKISTLDVVKTIQELEKQFGGPVPNLEVRRPSLEDRYLRLIGEGS